MLNQRFNRLWKLLLERWFVYQDTPRTPDRVTELAAARIELDEVRSAIASERGRIQSKGRSRREAPRVAMSEEQLDRLRVAGAGVDCA